MYMIMHSDSCNIEQIPSSSNLIYSHAFHLFRAVASMHIRF